MSRSISYRPHIDGLRAVAVILVVLYHAGVRGVGGGYIGVDVFFVITGFLITSIVRKGVLAGTFSFREFYLRRIKRLFPALIVVVATTVAVGFYLLQPAHLDAMVLSAVFTLVSVSNIYFWKSTGGYFDTDVEDLPLLHTWSLGVEEQFYLLWPGLLALAVRRLSRRAFVVTLAVVVVVGCALSEVGARIYPSSTYYWLPGRAFEITMGAALAVWQFRPALTKTQRTALATLGLAAVLLPGALLSKDSTFPGLNALWPCLGTCVLIFTGEDAEEPTAVHRLLGWKPLVFIGLGSYSIYLWHWPVIAYLSYVGIELRGALLWLAVVAPFALSAATYFAVEHPFRHRIRVGLPVAFGTYVVAPAAAAILLYGIMGDGGFAPRRAAAAASGDVSVAQPAQSPTASVKKECTYGQSIDGWEACVLGVESERVDGLVIGDSYAGMYGRFLDLLARDAGLSLRHVWYRLSPPIGGTSVGRRPNDEAVRYSQDRQQLLSKFRIAILVSSWGGYHGLGKNKLWDRDGKNVSGEAGDELQLKAIRELLDKGVKVVIVDRPPAPPGKMRIKQLEHAATKGSIVGAREKRPPVAAYGFVSRVRKAFPEVLIIQPFDVHCTVTDCGVEIGGSLLFRRDGSHLTHDGSQLLGQKYLELAPNPLAGLGVPATSPRGE